MYSSLSTLMFVQTSEALQKTTNKIILRGVQKNPRTGDAQPFLVWPLSRHSLRVNVAVVSPDSVGTLGPVTRSWRVVLESLQLCSSDKLRCLDSWDPLEDFFGPLIGHDFHHDLESHCAGLLRVGAINSLIG